MISISNPSVWHCHFYFEKTFFPIQMLDFDSIPFIYFNEKWKQRQQNTWKKFQRIIIIKRSGQVFKNRRILLECSHQCIAIKSGEKNATKTNFIGEKEEKWCLCYAFRTNKHSSYFMVFHCILCMFQYQVASVASSEMHKIHIFLWKNKYIECSWSCSAGMHTKSNKNRLTKAKRIAIVSRMVGIDPVFLLFS